MSRENVLIMLRLFRKYEFGTAKKMKNLISEKFVKKSIVRWLFRNGWGTNLEIGELRDKVEQYSWKDLKLKQN